MAISAPTSINTGAGTLGSTHTTGSFTPNAFSRVVAVCYAYRDGGLTATKPTVSDSLGGNWTELASIHTSNNTTKDMWIVIFIRDAEGASPAGRTCTFTSTSATGVAMTLLSFAGSDITGAIVQSAGGEDLANGDPAFTLGATPAAANCVFGAAFGSGTSAWTPPTGYTEQADVTVLTSHRVETFYDVTSAAISGQSFGTNTRSLILAVEFKIAPQITAPVSLIAGTGTAAAAHTTAGFTPAAGRRLLVAASALNSNTTCVKPTITSSQGLTFTELVSKHSSNATSSDMYGAIYISDQDTTAVSQTITVSSAGADSCNAIVKSLVTAEIAPAALQTTTAEDLVNGDPAFTWGAQPGLNGFAYYSAFAFGGGTFTPPSGYTEGVDATATTARQVTDGWDLSAAAIGPNTVTSLNGRVVLMAVEIAPFNPDASPAVTGVSATATAGTVLPKEEIPTTGVSVTATAGTVTTSTGGGTDASPAPAGVAATATAGSLLLIITDTPLGVSVTALAGSVTGLESSAVTGAACTASAGSLAPAESKAITGVSATASAGAMTPSESQTVTGVSATASAGSVTEAESKAVTGVAATASAGSLAIALASGLSGVAITAFAGTLTPAELAAVLGASAQAFAGSVAKTEQASAPGVSVTATAGSLAEALTAPLTGVAATAHAGSVSVSSSSGSSTTLAGVQAGAQAGSLAPALNDNLAGAAATATAGSLASGPAPSIPGVSATALAGSVSKAEAKPITGAAATAQAGALTDAIAEQIPGVSASAIAGSVAEAEAKPISGASATASAGSVTAVPADDLFQGITGVGIVASAGGINPATNDNLEGVAATAEAGSIRGPFYLTGASATAEVGAITFVILIGEPQVTEVMVDGYLRTQAWAEGLLAMPCNLNGSIIQGIAVDGTIE